MLSNLYMELVEIPFSMRIIQLSQILACMAICLIKMFGMEDLGMIYLNFQGY